MATVKEDLEALFRTYMGETVHTAFRKGADGAESHRVWLAIKELPPKQWSDACDWMAWALAYSLKGELIIKKAGRA